MSIALPHTLDVYHGIMFISFEPNSAKLNLWNSYSDSMLSSQINEAYKYQENMSEIHLYI